MMIEDRDEMLSSEAIETLHVVPFCSDHINFYMRDDEDEEE
jgi:hypothetical protein